MKFFFLFLIVSNLFAQHEEETAPVIRFEVSASQYKMERVFLDQIPFRHEWFEEKRIIGSMNTIKHGQTKSYKGFLKLDDKNNGCLRDIIQRVQDYTNFELPKNQLKNLVSTTDANFVRLQLIYNASYEGNHKATAKIKIFFKDSDLKIKSYQTDLRSWKKGQVNCGQVAYQLKYGIHRILGQYQTQVAYSKPQLEIKSENKISQGLDLNLQEANSVLESTLKSI